MCDTHGRTWSSLTSVSNRWEFVSCEPATCMIAVCALKFYICIILPCISIHVCLLSRASTSRIFTRKDFGLPKYRNLTKLFFQAADYRSQTLIDRPNCPTWKKKPVIQPCFSKNEWLHGGVNFHIMYATYSLLLLSLLV